MTLGGSSGHGDWHPTSQQFPGGTPPFSNLSLDPSELWVRVCRALARTRG